MNQPEIDLLESYIRYQINRGVKNIWVEVKTPLGIADVVYEQDGYYFIAEGKASKPTFHLLLQCERWRFFCAGIRAIIPYQPPSEELVLAQEVFGEHDTAIVMMKDGLPIIANHVEIRRDNDVIEYVNDANRYGGQWAKAGQSSGRRASKQNEEYAAIETYVAQNPGCSAAECAREGGMKASQLLKLIKQGKVRLDMEVRGGKTYVFPEVPL